MRVCYVTLVAAPWLAIAGMLSALCGLLVCADPGQVVTGGVALASAFGAGGLAYGLLRAQVVNAEWRSTWASARPGRPR